jgi:hypothetical protein
MVVMQVTMTSVPGHAGRSNEDFAGAVPNAAVVIDGAGIPGAESVCRHGVAWYANRLGGGLLGRLSLAPERGLPDLLAEVIEQVTDEHRDTCDVANPISPMATVAILRLSGDRADYLALGDTTLVIGPLVVTDPREVTIARPYRVALEATPEGSDEARRILRDLRARRNQPGGFWLAKDDPGAAAEAVTGSCPTAELAAGGAAGGGLAGGAAGAAAGAALLSNGASRIVDQFQLADWPGVLAMLASSGPAEVIRLVRRHEARHGVPTDDATIAYCTGLT